MIRYRHRRGFSLLELLAVLVLMGTVAVTVLPQFTKTGGAEVQAAARSLAAGLRRARSQAIQHNLPQSLTLDVERRTFELSFEPRARKLPEGLDLKLFTARSAVESAARGAIRFFADGGSTGGRITVRGPGREILVDVDWLTGRVRLLEGAGPRISMGSDSIEIKTPKMLVRRPTHLWGQTPLSLPTRDRVAGRAGKQPVSTMRSQWSLTPLNALNEVMALPS